MELVEEVKENVDSINMETKKKIDNISKNMDSIIDKAVPVIVQRALYFTIGAAVLLLSERWERYGIHLSGETLIYFHLVVWTALAIAGMVVVKRVFKGVKNIWLEGMEKDYEITNRSWTMLLNESYKRNKILHDENRAMKKDITRMAFLSYQLQKNNIDEAGKLDERRFLLGGK